MVVLSERITEQQQKMEKDVNASSGSLSEGPDMRVAVGTLHTVLVGAETSHINDMCTARMVALVTVSLRLQCAVVIR